MVPEREESEQGVKTLFEEIMIENFLHLFKKKKALCKFRESQSRCIQREPHQETSLLKWQRLKTKGILKTSRTGKTVNYLQGSSQRLSVDFSRKTFQVRQNKHDMFIVMKNKGLQPRLCPTRVSFIIEGKIKSFPDHAPSQKSSLLLNQYFKKC